MRRAALWLLATIAVLAVALAVLLALPVREWRTGERFENRLSAIPADAMPSAAERIWIDSDSACGAGDRVDPDDCLSILYLAFHEGVDVVGLSTVFGNAPLEVTDRIGRELARLLAAHGGDRFAVHTGAARPREDEARPATNAQRSLSEALADGPLTILALGPLTNVAAALRARPDLAGRIERVVAVMGRRPGHVFHPSEASGEGMLFGHGPIFRDLNVALDTEAVGTVLAHRVPLTLIPYEAARAAELDSAALDRLAAAGPAHAWVAERARPW
ncbi:MAG: nucleoside hydrolase, partial [Gammaproteobacteria bacterium]|nr:nucleoside hydrolase [Gammaproteobacteria bacterium]